MPSKPFRYVRLASIGGKPARTIDKAERDKFYSSAEWLALRASHLAEHPLCVHCDGQGRLRLATVVHHKIERLSDSSLALDPDNLESVCNPCHTAYHKRRKGKA